MKITIKSFSKELNPLINELGLNNSAHISLQKKIWAALQSNHSKKSTSDMELRNGQSNFYAGDTSCPVQMRLNDVLQLEEE